MKKHVALFVSLSILACLMVLPVIRSVNTLPGKSEAFSIADGNPMPNPLPPAFKAGVLAADGNPMPNPLPPNG
jgi:hypothetical protein